MGISQDIPQPSIAGISLKINYIKFHSNFVGVNGLTQHLRCIGFYEFFSHPCGHIAAGLGEESGLITGCDIQFDTYAMIRRL